jgi:hypothetical protein
MGKIHTFGKYEIDEDLVYYIAYAGGTREMSPKDEKEYKGVIALPYGAARQKALRDLGPEKDPHLIPIQGKKLIEIIIDANLTPLFDLYFDRTHALQISDEIVYESIRQKNYDLARGK